MIVEFELVRNEDESGVSGTGVVAEGVILDHGACVVTWFNSLTVNVYTSPWEVIDIHGHGGKTRLRAKRGRLQFTRGKRTTRGDEFEAVYMNVTADGLIGAHYYHNKGRWIVSKITDPARSWDVYNAQNCGLAQGAFECGFSQPYDADSASWVEPVCPYPDEES